MMIRSVLEAKSEQEGFGLVYERFALGKLLENLVKKYDIRSILELPGGGVKAMPSIYSICMGLAGCHVTVVNGESKSLGVWERLGIEDRISMVDCDDLAHTDFPARSFDLVWNFAVFSTFQTPIPLLKEMKRVANKYVCLFLCNGKNIGSVFHRFAHWWTKIPWTHGDASLRTLGPIRTMMETLGIAVETAGYVDTPPWPDAIGFRDIRLHKLTMEKNLDLAKMLWTSKYIDYLDSNQFPTWIRAVYAFEKIPMPNFLRQFYAHLFYVVGKV